MHRSHPSRRPRSSTGRRLLLVCAVAVLCASAASGTAQAADPAPTALPAPPGGETEPNNSVASASPIASGERVRASVSPGGDLDLYRFTAEAGDRVFATTMTSGSASTSTDSTLTLLGSDGTTVIETDDDNGSLAGLSSSVAGATIPTAGTYYLEVKAFADPPTLVIRPYDLLLEVRSGAPATEAEPNDAPATAGSLTGGFAAGARDSGTDQDWYALELNAGDTVFLSLDLDPERDGTTFNGQLGFGDANLIGVVNDPGTAEADAIDSEAYVATVTTGGTHYAFVNGSGASGPAATYHLSVTVIPAVQPSCRTYTITPSPGSIPDRGEATFAIDVSDPATVDRVAIALDVAHDRMADLDATLQAPGGNQIALFTDVGSSTVVAGTRNVALFDDNAGAPPHLNRTIGFDLQPEPSARLGYFSGQQAAGTWNLTLRDDATDHGGTLARADLIICAGPEEGPSETVFSADFESADDGFTHSGSADEWERGVPATGATGRVAGLSTCAEGAGCFKTDLDGTYDANSSQDLLSPPISLAGRTGQIYASWSMWYQLERADFDHATVSVEEDGGSNARRLFTWDGADMFTTVGVPIVTVPFAAGWGVRRADVSDYAGKTIRLRFHVDSDNTVQLAGLAIDDVRVYQPTFDLDLALAGSGSGYVDSTPAGIDCGTDAAAHPTCSMTALGAVTLTAHPGAGSTFAGFSGGGCSGTATTCAVTLDQDRSVTATFDDIPDAPVAGDDSYSTDEDSPLSVDAPGVLGNDGDADGDSLTAAVASDPEHGRLVLAADGSLTYTPDRDYNGGDSFTYRASDGSLQSGAATVTIDVRAVADTPHATADAYAIDEDTPLSVDAPGVLGNDGDADGDSLTAAVASDPEHGRLVLAADGSLTYTPDRDYNGSDTFTYRAGDGGLQSEPATVTIQIRAVDDPGPAPKPPAPPAPRPPANPAPTPGGAPRAERAISHLRLGSRCVRRSRSGRVRIPMTMRMARPGAVEVQVDRVIGNKARRTCPPPPRTRRHPASFRRVATVRVAPTQAVAAAVPRRLTLKLRLAPGLYRITVRAHLEGDRVSRPVHRFVRVLRRRAATPHG